jgi:hypothetical protein
MKTSIRSYKHVKLVILILIIGSITLSGVWLSDYSRSKKFSTEVWKASSAERTGGAASNPRRFMVKDIFANYLTNGISRESVLVLLGPPDFPDANSDSQLWYFVGEDSRYGKLLPGNLYLVLDFSPERKLKQWRILSPD